MSASPVLAKIQGGNLSAPLQLVFERAKDHPLTPPERMKDYPELRYMGSKNRLIPWIHGVLSNLDFEAAADPFSGSGCIPYLMKTMG